MEDNWTTRSLELVERARRGNLRPDGVPRNYAVVVRCHRMRRWLLNRLARTRPP